MRSMSEGGPLKTIGVKKKDLSDDESALWNLIIFYVNYYYYHKGGITTNVEHAKLRKKMHTLN